MAVSRVDLANEALAHLTGDSLRSLDGNSHPAAVKVNLYMDSAIEEVICEYDWPSCRVVSTLIQAPGVDLRGWTVAYVIPSDCVRLWRVSDARGEVVSKFESGMSSDLGSDTNYIYAEDSGLFIRYGSRRASLSRHPADLIALMGLKLAVKCCIPITKDKNLKAKLEEQYLRDLSKVKTIIANLEPELQDVEYIPELISVRFS